MFLICRDKGTCVSSLSKLISKVEGIACGPIQIIELGDHWLGWSRSKTHENLHIFNDGIIIGKLSFSEKSVDTIIYHIENLPAEIHPLTNGLSIKSKGNGSLITPFNITNVFYGGDSVSDMQLLIAEAEGFLPSPEGVGVLATVGFFPGNLTLFSEIKKIPLLLSYDLNAHQLTNVPFVSFNKPDDVGLIERLKKIVPDHPCQYLGMSAGYDSRFVLGILRQSGVIPQLIHISGDETKLVLEIAEQLNIPCIPFVCTESVYLSPEIYTLVTDAQIYFRGGNYSCLRNSIESESLFHWGHFSPPLMKNASKDVYTKPGANNSNIYSRLIDHLFIRVKEGMTFGLCNVNSLQDIKKFLFDELKYGSDYCSFRTRKEFANWFDYIHWEIRWVSAHMADLFYFTQPVFLLSDLEALKLGISSDEWLNYKNDRVRNLNAALLPELTVTYHDRGKYRVDNGLVNNWEKIEKEYISRYYKYLKDFRKILYYLDRNKTLTPPKNTEFPFSFKDVNFRAQDFTRYFTNSFDEIVTGSTYSYWLKRAAVTVGYTLQFLGH